MPRFNERLAVQVPRIAYGGAAPPHTAAHAVPVPAPPAHRFRVAARRRLGRTGVAGAVRRPPRGTASPACRTASSGPRTPARPRTPAEPTLVDGDVARSPASAPPSAPVPPYRLRPDAHRPAWCASPGPLRVVSPAPPGDSAVSVHAPCPAPPTPCPAPARTEVRPCRRNRRNRWCECGNRRRIAATGAQAPSDRRRATLGGEPSGRLSPPPQMGRCRGTDRQSPSVRGTAMQVRVLLPSAPPGGRPPHAAPVTPEALEALRSRCDQSREIVREFGREY